MHYEELDHRYGMHVALRLRGELTPAEFDQVSLDQLPKWLKARAEAAHENYRKLLNNPVILSEQDFRRTGEACRAWRAAEDLAYLIAVAEDVGITACAI